MLGFMRCVVGLEGLGRCGRRLVAVHCYTTNAVWRDSKIYDAFAKFGAAECPSCPGEAR